MIKKAILTIWLGFALAGRNAAAETVEGLPLHVKTLAPGAVRVWAGDHISATAVCAVATRKGIVVIDTTNIPKLDAAFRQVIARELGRDDFACLINTHGHVDHVSGNGVYAGGEIIAHESVKGMMEESFRDIPRRIQWMEQSIQEQKEQLSSGKVKEEEKAVALEQLAYNSLVADYLKSSPRPTFPTKTFRDRLVLDCGDVTFELYQAGGTHTPSDIFVLAPQKGLLFTGDMMADKWLTDVPGCLGTFAAHSGEAADYPVLMKNWQALLERKNEIRLYVPGHWNGELSLAGFQARHDYLKAMLADVQAMAKSGDDFNRFLAAYTLKDKFSQLVGSPGISNQGHQMSVKHLYQVYSGKKWLVGILQSVIMGERFAADFPALKADILKNRDQYFFTGADLNGLGYFLMQQLKNIDGAVAMFELYAELFPQDWNAWDSLAEGYYTHGDKKKALELYRKSLELNPANENGKKFIERIEGERANK